MCERLVTRSLPGLDSNDINLMCSEDRTGSVKGFEGGDRINCVNVKIEDNGVVWTD